MRSAMMRVLAGSALCGAVAGAVASMITDAY